MLVSWLSLVSCVSANFWLPDELFVYECLSLSLLLLRNFSLGRLKSRAQFGAPDKKEDEMDRLSCHRVV